MKNKILPQGDLMRQLLVKSNITDATINKVLREKGVFLGHSNKNNSVPLLMKTLVSPEDFEFLYDAQKTKDESFKYRNSSIKCAKDFEFADVLNEEVDIHNLIKNKFTYKPNYVVIGNPTFFYEDSNNATLEFEIEKENPLNGFYDSITRHKGSISLRKVSDGGVQISVQQNSTSKDTLEVNNILMSVLKDRLFKNSIINSSDDIVSIKFNHFYNSSRILFFYGFAKNFNVYLDFKSITDIDLYIDGNVDSHEDLKAFLNEIDNLKLNGKDLQNHILLRKAKYYPKLILASLKFRYNISYEGIKCAAVITMGFPDYVKNKDVNAEFQISIELILEKANRSSSNDIKIRKKILEQFEIKKMESYEKFKL